MTIATTAPPPRCPSCGANLAGRFCGECGEKRLDPDRDWSLRWLVGQLLEGFLNLDGKLLRTFGLLLFRPGQLTRAFLDGRRVRYLGPVQLFLLAAVVFYLFFSRAYAAPIEMLARNYEAGSFFGNVLHYDIATALRQKAVPPDTEAMLATRLFAQAGEQSKVWLGMLILPLAIAHRALLRRRERRFVPHLVAASHAFCAFLLLDLAFLFCCRMLSMDSVADSAFLPLLLVYVAHQTLALRAAFACAIVEAVIVALALGATLTFGIVFYRQIVTVAVVALA